MIDRRGFLKIGLAAGAVAFGLQVRQALAYAVPGPKAEGRLIVVFLRGGLDGLFAFAPVDDSRLGALRPSLSATAASQGIRLQGTGFVAHPACAGLAAMFASGELSFAPCAGTTDRSRSHFQAQDLFELGTGAIRGGSGFMARAATMLGGEGRAISFTQEVPLSFAGMEIPPEIAPLAGSGLKIPPGRLRDAILVAHQGAATGAALAQAIATEADIEAAMGMEPGVSRGAAGANDFPGMARRMGRMLLAKPALGLAFVDLGGFDTHAGEEAILTRALASLSGGLDALRSELGPQEWRRTRLVVMTEFGRTVRENGTRGTDHGHGGLALLAGGDIDGGKLLGGFDGLADSALNETRDLPVKVDWRDLIGAEMTSLFALETPALDRIFPGRPGRKFA